MITLLLLNNFYPLKEKESDQLLYTVRSLVMVREPAARRKGKVQPECISSNNLSIRDGFMTDVYYLHAEWFVSLLQTARRKKFQSVHVLSESQFRFLSDAERECWHETVALHVGERRLTTERVHQQFPVQREACVFRLMLVSRVLAVNFNGELIPSKGVNATSRLKV